MVIDTHQHAFWSGCDDAALVADMDKHGIDFAWLLTWEIPQHAGYPERFTAASHLNPARLRADGSHPGIPLEDLIIARDRYPDRFLLGYCPDPAMPNAPALLEAAITMHGVRVCGEWKFRILLDDPRSLELFRMAGRHGAPVVLHLDVPYLPQEQGDARYVPDWYGGSVAHLERAIQSCPDTVFIGHAPGFWREISQDAERCPELYPTGPIVPGGRLTDLLVRYPNLYADLSANSALRALKRDVVHAREFIQRHAGKLLFARDRCGGELQAFLSEMGLGADVTERLFCGNALSLVDHMRFRSR